MGRGASARRCFSFASGTLGEEFVAGLESGDTWRLWSPHSFPTPWFGNWVSVASSWSLRAVPGGEKSLLLDAGITPSPVPSLCHSLRLPVFPKPRSSPLLHPQGDKFCIHFLHLPILRRRWFDYLRLLAGVLGGCYPGGAGEDSSWVLPPVAPLEIGFQKLGKLRGGKDGRRLWEELVAGVARGTSAPSG